jgi:hypothetical protein
MLDIGTTFLGAYLVSYAIAVVTPTWRWLLALTLVAAVIAGWLRDWIALLLPNAEGPGTAIGGALALVVTIGFSTGVLVGGDYHPARAVWAWERLCRRDLRRRHSDRSSHPRIRSQACLPIQIPLRIGQLCSRRGGETPRRLHVFAHTSEGGGVRQRSSSLRSMRPEKPLPFVAYGAASAPLRSPACNIQHRRVRRYPAVPALKPG